MNTLIIVRYKLITARIIHVICCMLCYVTVTLATINAISAKWGIRIHTFFTVSKLLALSIIIIVGLVNLAQGKSTSRQWGYMGISYIPEAAAGFCKGGFNLAVYFHKKVHLVNV